MVKVGPASVAARGADAAHRGELYVLDALRAAALVAAPRGGVLGALGAGDEDERHHADHRALGDDPDDDSVVVLAAVLAGAVDAGQVVVRQEADAVAPERRDDEDLERSHEIVGQGRDGAHVRVGAVRGAVRELVAELAGQHAHGGDAPREGGAALLVAPRDARVVGGGVELLAPHGLLGVAQALDGDLLLLALHLALRL